MAFTKLVNALLDASLSESKLGYLAGRDDACSAEAQFMVDIYKSHEPVWLVLKEDACKCWLKFPGSLGAFNPGVEKEHPDVFNGDAVFLRSRSSKFKPTPDVLERAKCWAPLIDSTSLSCDAGIVCASFRKFAKAHLPKVVAKVKEMKEKEKEKNKKKKTPAKSLEKPTPVGQQKKNEGEAATPTQATKLFIDLTIEPSSDEQEKSLSSASPVKVTSPAKRAHPDNHVPMATASASKRRRSVSTMDTPSSSPKKARLDAPLENPAEVLTAAPVAGPLNDAHLFAISMFSPTSPVKVAVAAPVLSPVAGPFNDAHLFAISMFSPTSPAKVAVAAVKPVDPIQVLSAPMPDDAVDMDIGDFAKTLHPPAGDEEEEEEKKNQETPNPEEEDPMEVEKKVEELLNKYVRTDAEEDEKKDKEKAPDPEDPMVLQEEEKAPMAVEKPNKSFSIPAGPLVFKPWVNNVVTKDDYLSTYDVSGFSQHRRLRLSVSSGDALFKGIAKGRRTKVIVDNLGRADCKDWIENPPAKSESDDLEKLVSLAKPAVFDRPKHFFGVRDHVLKASAKCKIALMCPATVVIHTTVALRVFPNPVDERYDGALTCWTMRGGLTIDPQGMVLSSGVHYFCCSNSPVVELTLSAVAGNASLTVAGLTESTVMPLVFSDPIGALSFSPYQDTATNWLDTGIEKTRSEELQLEKANSRVVQPSQLLDIAANRNVFLKHSMDTGESGNYSMHVQAKVLDPKEPNEFSLESKLEFMAFSGPRGKGIIIIDGFVRSLDLTHPIAELEKGGFLTLETYDPANDDMFNLLREYRSFNAKTADRIALAESIEKLGVALWGPLTNTFRASIPVQAPQALPASLSSPPSLRSSKSLFFLNPGSGLRTSVQLTKGEEKK